MQTAPNPALRGPIDPGLEALELRDIGARDCSPSAGPLGSVVTWTDVDRMWVEDQERRDSVVAAHTASRARHPLPPAGWRDAACLGCNVAVLVRVSETGDILCSECEAAGNAAAASDDPNGDDDPDRQPGAGLPGGFIMRDAFASYIDDNLVLAVDVLDRGRVEKITEAQRQELLAAATAELVTRLDAHVAEWQDGRMAAA
jgi:hypothetical protein